uniref:Small ribosomal subunit protein mS29 n=2 Tax=Cuerna arida TaxID=1464854 RepID=A0A1B6F8W6_9HEMI
MSSFKFLRSTFALQLCSRGFSTETAAATFQPTKVAVRTSQSDPTNHTMDDVGKLYTMPKGVRDKLFPKYVLPLYFEQLCDTFHETNIIVRQPAIELIDYLKRADYNRPIIRYVIYGKYGCGKTLTLIHAMNYAFNNNFIIVYVPSVWRWFHWSREVVASERDPAILDLPLDASTWLKQFELTNAELISKLDLRLSKTQEWSPREKTVEGSTLNELVLFGINRVKYACQVIDVLLNELKNYARQNSCKVFAAIDGFNGFFQTTSRLKTPERVRLIPSNVSLTHSFRSFVNNDWNNGAAVLVADDHATVKGHYKSHLPFHLLQKAGVESIDPFIPINVPVYSPLEFQNYLDYLEEKRWLQKPEGRDEIDFVTQRNPRMVNTYCANR